MSLSNISYTGQGRTLEYEDLACLVEQALETPSNVYVPVSASKLNSDDELYNLSFTSAIKLPYIFGKNLVKLIRAHRRNDPVASREAWLKLTTLPFGVGGALTTNLRLAFMLNLATNLTLMVLTPFHIVFAAFFFLGQIIFDMYQGYNSGKIHDMIDKEVIEAFEKLDGPLDETDRDALRNTLEAKREILTSLLGEESTEALFTYLDFSYEDMTQEEILALFPDIEEEQVNPEVVGQQIHRSIRALEANFLDRTIQNISAKAISLSTYQKEEARKLFQDNIQTLPPGKAMELTFGAIQSTSKANFARFSHAVRPHVASKFVQNRGGICENLRASSLARQEEGIAKARELLLLVKQKATETSLLHSFSILGALICFGVIAFYTAGVPLALVITASVVETAYLLFRNVIAYGFLDAEGKTFDIQKCIPEEAKKVYRFFKRLSTQVRKITLFGSPHLVDPIVSG